MTIAIVAGFCVLLLIIAFLVPRLSHGPERGGSKVAGAPKKATSKAPGQARALALQAVPQLAEGDPQERQHRPQGPQQDAVLAPSRRPASRATPSATSARHTAITPANPVKTAAISNSGTEIPMPPRIISF